MSKWESFIGVPHTSVAIEGYEKMDDYNKGKPVGLKDPLKVFSMIKQDDEDVLAVSGLIYGGFTTKQEYGNYHFSIEMKWGEKKYEPRLQMLRDSGLLYHCVGAHGAFWNVWMQCIEYQVQEGDMGDLYLLAGTAATVTSKPLDKGQVQYDATGAPVDSRKDAIYKAKRGPENYEKPNGEWNVLEYYVVGDHAVHLVNGKKVLEIKNMTAKLDDKVFQLTKGKIQIQSEGAECYYRRASVKPITEIPADLLEK